MTAERDLFGEDHTPAPRRVGGRIHLPRAVRSLAESMRQEGASVAEIAKAIGISQGTAWRRLAVELERGMPGGRSVGRPLWSPSAEARATVVRMTVEFATVEAIAERLGCSAPTLRLHCRAELAEGRKLRRGGAE